jgi:hypothetical protein
MGILTSLHPRQVKKESHEKYAGKTISGEKNITLIEQSQASPTCPPDEFSIRNYLH